MTAVSRPKKIDELMERASRALAQTSYFEAERLAMEALELARKSKDFDRLARIALPLQEARRQRVQAAIDAGFAAIIDSPLPEGGTIEPGCYLVRPPQVGADARRFRLAALEQEVPVLVVCREPATQLGLVPIVAIAPGMTVRAKVRPPKDPDDPGVEWLLEAMEALGDDAVDLLDPGLATTKRLDILITRLDAIPDHEGLHIALAETCREAEREEAESEGSSSRRKAPKVKR